MPNEQLIRAFLEKASAEGTRSTALKPLNYLLLVLVPATLASFWADMPSWAGLAFVTFLAITLTTYIACYVYLMLTDKDALRSEKFTIQKLAIEKGLYGDSLTGTLDANDVTDAKLLTIDSGNDEEGSE